MSNEDAECLDENVWDLIIGRDSGGDNGGDGVWGGSTLMSFMLSGSWRVILADRTRLGWVGGGGSRGSVNVSCPSSRIYC